MIPHDRVLFSVQAPLPWKTERCVALAWCMYQMSELQQYTINHPHFVQVGLSICRLEQVCLASSDLLLTHLALNGMQFSHCDCHCLCLHAAAIWLDHCHGRVALDWCKTTCPVSFDLNACTVCHCTSSRSSSSVTLKLLPKHEDR